MQKSIPPASPLALELDAVPASVTEARHAAAALAERVGADRGAVELAMAEAVGNAVLHAYPEATGRVSVTGRLEGGSLMLLVRDWGVGMRPNPASQGLGFGLPLIAQLASGVEILEPQGGGTELRMRFVLAER
jgi:two-component sensor histidine kinase